MRTYSILSLVAALLACVIVNAGATSRNENNHARTAAQLYGKYCSTCHGRDGRGQTKKGKFSHARDLSDAKWQEDVTDERIFNSIMNGREVRGTMPGFKDKLNEKEVESLVGLVRGLKK